MALESVRLVNPGPNAFRNRFEGRWYEIPVGTEVVLDERMMWQWLGRPYLVDKPDDKARTEEYLRLRALYGSDYPEIRDGQVVKNAEQRWDELKPSLEAFKLDGTRLITVVDDPEGAQITPAEQATKAEQANIDSTIAEMREQIAALQRLQGEGRVDIPDTLTLDDIPGDDPQTVPVGPRRGKER